MNYQDAIYHAIRASKESLCRSKRGVVIWDRQGVISIAHNHQPAPFVCDGSEACKRNCGKTAIHAEQKAILMADRRRLVSASLLHIKTRDGAAVPSGGPSCLECSKLILEAGISFIWLLHENGWHWYTAVDFHHITAEGHHNMLLLHPDTIGTIATEAATQDNVQQPFRPPTGGFSD